MTAPRPFAMPGLGAAPEPPPSWTAGCTAVRDPFPAAVLRRAADIMVATTALVLLAPLLALLCAAIRLESSGSAIFAQTREGRGRRPFTIYKLRTMRMAPGAPGAPLLWTAEDDPRLTGLGRRLRKVRLDELPQLFNVMRGDMSLVGPRPQRPALNDMLPADLAPLLARRCAVRPGLTGWAQVNGGYFATGHDPDDKARQEALKLAYDMDYLDRRSLAFDLEILWRTIGVVLGRRGQ